MRVWGQERGRQVEIPDTDRFSEDVGEVWDAPEVEEIFVDLQVFVSNLS